MPRFSVRMLLIGVAAVAVGTVALINASGTWARLIFAVAVAANVVALIGAAVTRRPGFVGFALAGWAYLLLSSSPILGPRVEWLQPGLDMLAPLRTRIERLVPRTALETEDGWREGVDYIRVLGKAPATPGIPGVPPPTLGYLVPTPRHMQQVAHGLCCLAAGCLGAWVGPWLSSAGLVTATRQGQPSKHREQP